MKVLIVGANGFVGRNAIEELRRDSSLMVIVASRDESGDVVIDLMDYVSVESALKSSRPDVIVNCAGIVMNTEEVFNNGVFCKNIFEAIIAIDKPYPKVIITGSAAEYGVVENVDEPVSEEAPLNATSNYGKSKIEEVVLAQEYAKKYDIDVVVARIFNPIGPGMGKKFLLSNLIDQLNELQKNQTKEISLSRLDAKRDYVDVRDVATAIHAFVVVHNEHHHIVQNVGSGKSTTNGELLNKLLDRVELTKKPIIIETQTEPEPAYAAKADLTRIKTEYGWEPKYNLSTTMEDIIHGQSAR